MADARLNIIIDALNNASSELKQVQGDLEGLENVGKSSNTSMANLGKTMGDIGRPMRTAGLAITGGVTVPLMALIAKSTLSAARVDELDLVIEQLGKSSGYGKGELEGHVQAVRDMGIEAGASREIIAKFVTAQLDAGEAANLARIAQDQAVISGENSTETMSRLTDALITGNSQMFRTLGMSLDLGAAYDEMASSLGKSTAELTEVEKIQARVNAVTEHGVTIQGNYEAAMGDSFKQMGSYKRYLDDIFIALGQHFTPALNTAVFAVGDMLQAIPELVSEGGALGPMFEGWGENASKAADILAVMTNKVENLNPVTAKLIGHVIGVTAVLGPLLLVGGQALIWASKLTVAVKTLGVAKMALLGPVGLATAAIAGFVAISLEAQSQELKAIETSKELHGEILETSESYEEYKDRVADANDAKREELFLSGDMHIARKMEKEGLELLTAEQWLANKAIAEGALEMNEAELRARGLIDASSDLKDETIDLTEAVSDADYAMQSYNEKLLFSIASQNLSDEAALDLAYAMGLVDERTVYATGKIDEWDQMLDDGLITLDLYNAWVRDLNIEMGKITDKSATITLSWQETGKPSGSAMQYMGQYYTPPKEATGGPVMAGNPYQWQEYGYKGEVMVPSQDGFVLSRADAKRILSEAGKGSGGGGYMGPSADDIGLAVRDALLTTGVL